MPQSQQGHQRNRQQDDSTCIAGEAAKVQVEVRQAIQPIIGWLGLIKLARRAGAWRHYSRRRLRPMR